MSRNVSRGYHPLPAYYRHCIDSLARIRLVIMGKDPYPSNPVGIPFCKETWKEQTKGNCSGLFVLQSLSIDIDKSKAKYGSPKELFVALAGRGVVFLNVSYHFIGKPISRNMHMAQLKGAAKVNDAYLKKARNIVLCGEARKCGWFGQVPENALSVVHPDIRNKNKSSRRKQWMEWWDKDAISTRFNLGLLEKEI